MVALQMGSTPHPCADFQDPRFHSYPISKCMVRSGTRYVCTKNHRKTPGTLLGMKIMEAEHQPLLITVFWDSSGASLIPLGGFLCGFLMAFCGLPKCPFCCCNGRTKPQDKQDVVAHWQALQTSSVHEGWS